MNLFADLFADPFTGPSPGFRRRRKYGRGWRISPWSSLKKFWASGAVALLMVSCGAPEEPSETMNITTTRLSYDQLTGWAQDDLAQALGTFRKSCARLAKRAADAPLDAKRSSDGLYGRVGDWQPACKAALALAAQSLNGPDEKAARAFFEARFTPFLITVNKEEMGLFTGYYEPEIEASKVRQGPYQTPLLAAPSDLVTVDLSLFGPALSPALAPALFKESLRGRVENGRLVPYPSRRDIETKGLPATGPLAWVADPVDAFFMHIQGSGRLLYPDGTSARLAFAQKNGRPYTPIGRALIERGALTAENVSMATIRDWLSSHPDQTAEILHLNESYIFFKPVADAGDPANSLGPPGAAGINLTPKRSLAVDRRHHPLGALIWLETSAPSGPGGADEPFRRLMVAQDTGSAILGPIRGDVFWGSGANAGAIAGAMKHAGRLVILLPNERLGAMNKEQ